MERSFEIEQLIEAWFAAASAGDDSLVWAHVSHWGGTRLIESDSSEVFRGGAQVAEVLAAEIRGVGQHATFTASDTEAFAAGDLGWATASITITLRDGRFVAPRWSAVLRRDDGVWKFIQVHASLVLPNDAIVWNMPATPTLDSQLQAERARS